MKVKTAADILKISAAAFFRQTEICCSGVYDSLWMNSSGRKDVRLMTVPTADVNNRFDKNPDSNSVRILFYGVKTKQL